MYVLVRKDLSPSQQAVQAAHAAIEATRHFLTPDAEHPHLVLCGIASEVQLSNALARAQACGICCKPFFESDLDGQLTAFATEPLSGIARNHFRRYNLLQVRALEGAA